MEVINMLFMKRLLPLLSIVLLASSLHAGVIEKVTKADLKDKQVIFFHDKHEGKALVGTSWYDVFDLAEKQEKPLQLFVEQVLQNSNAKVPVLLECRNELKTFLQTHDSKKLLTLNGYFNQFYNEYANPNSDYGLATQCDFDNFDVRDESDLTDLHDKFAPLLKRISPDSWPKDGLLLGFRTRGMWENLDRKKNSKLQEIVNDPAYQQEKQDILTRYKNVFTKQSILQVKKRAMDLIDQLQPFLPEHGILPLRMSMQHRLGVIDEIVKRYEQEDLLVGIYNWLETPQGSFARLGSDLKAFMNANNIPVDLQLLCSVLQAEEPVVMVHAGGLHIKKVLDDLRGMGAQTKSVIPFQTEQEVDNAQTVYNKLCDLLPKQTTVKVNQEKKTTEVPQKEISYTTESATLLSDGGKSVGLIASIITVIKTIFSTVFGG